MVKKEIPHRNKSPYGWWVASYVATFVPEGIEDNGEDTVIRAWENTIIIKANDREEAYKKAVEFGCISNGSESRDDDGVKYTETFEGLTSLLPIYNELGDGEEILWREYTDKKISEIKSWICKKEELETFQDEDYE